MRMEDMIMVSVDDHVVEPPHLFTTHAPAKYRDKMPQFKVRDNGTNAWEFEGLELSNIALKLSGPIASIVDRPIAESIE